MLKRVIYGCVLALPLAAALPGCGGGEAPAPPPGAQNADAPPPQVEMTSGGEVTK